MKVSQGEQSQSQVVLNIEVEPEELEEHLNGVYRRVVQQVNIPGFRKGKAPRAVVERFVGRDVLIEDALESLVPSMTSRAIQEQSLDVVATPRARVTQQNPVIIEATVALRPTVELGDYHQIRLEPEEVEVTSEQVDQLVEVLRQQMGTWEPVERPVEFGDMVTMDVTGIVEERPVVEDEGVDYIVSQESSNPMPGFGEQLVGIGTGEQREFSLLFAEDYPDPDLAGKVCAFTVSVAEVKERKLPEPDDEFAKSLTMGAETFAELWSKLEEDLRQQSQSAVKRRFEDHVVNTVIEGATIELPELMVDDEIHHVLADQEEALRRQQVSMEDYLSTVGKTPEEIHEEARPAAVERITRTLVLRKVAEEEGIEVSDAEVEEEIGSMLEGQEPREEPLRAMLTSEDGRISITNVLKNRKTVERLTQIARGESVSASSEPEESAITEEVKGE
ncbi:MAG: trigger factor [Chloroflexi bacterium]|nr:trigger factor [Chloroflexota bacterium]